MAPAVAACLLALTACSPPPGGRPERLSIATGGTGGVYYPYGGGLARIISEHLDGVEATAEVTAASVDNLKLLADGKSDIAFTLADTLDEAVNGTGSFSEFGAVPVAALAVLYSNYTHLVALAGSGVERVADLRGRAVSVGAPGSGTEVIARRVLATSGLDADRDIRRQHLAVGASADALKDGKIDAFFWSGGLPTGAVLDLSHSPGVRIRLVPSGDAIPALQRDYGPDLYFRLAVPPSTYPGVDQEVPVVGVSNLLVVRRDMADALAYDITRLLFERQAELAAVHPEASRLALETAVKGSPAPLHPGSIRYYRERGLAVE